MGESFCLINSQPLFGCCEFVHWLHIGKGKRGHWICPRFLDFDFEALVYFRACKRFCPGCLGQFAVRGGIVRNRTIEETNARRVPPHKLLIFRLRFRSVVANFSRCTGVCPFGVAKRTRRDIAQLPGSPTWRAGELRKGIFRGFAFFS